MQELEVTWNRVLSVAWLILWRWIFGIWFLMILIGFVGVAILKTMELLGMTVPFESANIGQVVGPPVGMMSPLLGLILLLFVVRTALRKKYGEFQIVLVPNSSN